MNTISNQNNNVNFTAKLKLHPTMATEQAKRLQNIAETFEAKTKKYANDVFEIHGNKDDGFMIYHFDKNSEHENCADISTNVWNELFKKNDEYITKKFVKLLNIFKKRDTEFDKASKYIDSVIKKDKNNDPTNFEDKFWDIVVEKADKDRDIAVAKDSVLKSFDVY